MRARDLLAVLLPVTEKVLDAEHPDSLTARANLASWTGRAGDPAAAFAARFTCRTSRRGPAARSTR